MDNKPTLLLLCGLPGSGKSTWAHNYITKYPDTIYLSSDNIRKELYGDESCQDDPAKVFSLMQQRCLTAIKAGRDTIYDATNITRKSRATIINVCKRYAVISCYIIWNSVDNCITQELHRDRVVGKLVIDKMLKRFQAPFYDEGIDNIYIIKPFNWSWKPYSNACLTAMQISHQNPHHTLDIYDHCWAARSYLYKVKASIELCNAGMLHDLGKPYTKAFINSKGEPCAEAHYYQHQCVGAYMPYGFEYVTPKIAWLISTHMDPFLNTKYYNQLPANLKADLDVLHSADLAAH